jgi:hypothetical protein
MHAIAAEMGECNGKGEKWRRDFHEGVMVVTAGWCSSSSTIVLLDLTLSFVWLCM